jgi:hypothetical protein
MDNNMLAKQTLTWRSISPEDVCFMLTEYKAPEEGQPDWRSSSFSGRFAILPLEPPVSRFRKMVPVVCQYISLLVQGSDGLVCWPSKLGRVLPDTPEYGGEHMTPFVKVFFPGGQNAAFSLNDFVYGFMWTKLETTGILDDDFERRKALFMDDFLREQWKNISEQDVLSWLAK